MAAAHGVERSLRAAGSAVGWLGSAFLGSVSHLQARTHHAPLPLPRFFTFATYLTFIYSLTPRLDPFCAYPFATGWPVPSLPVGLCIYLLHLLFFPHPLPNHPHIRPLEAGLHFLLHCSSVASMPAGVPLVTFATAHTHTTADSSAPSTLYHLLTQFSYTHSPLMP